MVTEFEGVSKLRTSLLKDLLFQGSQDIRQQRTAIPERWGENEACLLPGSVTPGEQVCAVVERRGTRSEPSSLPELRGQGWEFRETKAVSISRKNNIPGGNKPPRERTLETAEGSASVLAE